jgi:hypothetical protein
VRPARRERNMASRNRVPARAEPEKAMTVSKTAYQDYLADPDGRGRIDRAVARLRAEAMRKFIVAPVAGCLKRIAAIARAARPAIKPLNRRQISWTP